MTFDRAVRAGFRNYAVFDGREGRPAFWYWFGFVVLGNLIARAFDTALLGPGQLPLIGIAFGLATLLPTIAYGARRLHDQDRSAWWVALWLVPVIGVILVLILCVLPGSPGHNRFGPPPE